MLTTLKGKLLYNATLTSRDVVDIIYKNATFVTVDVKAHPVDITPPHRFLVTIRLITG
jgi:hypothetical protein